MTPRAFDIVIMHVDGAAPGYEALYTKWAGPFIPCQLRSLGELRYVLRSIVQYASPTQRVVLVVQDRGHVPSWLDERQLRIVCHEEFLPSQVLPTFHWATIAAHLHLIPDLSERYVIWEDDVLLGRKLAADLFFDDEPRTGVCAFPIWQRERHSFLDTYGRNLAHTCALLSRTMGVRGSNCFIYPHMPLPVTRAAWTEFFDSCSADDVFRDTVTRRSRGDERQTATVDPLVAFANWFDIVKCKRSAYARYASFLRVHFTSLSGSYPVVNELRRMRRHMVRMKTQRPVFMNINDDAYDDWLDGAGQHSGSSAMPNPQSLTELHNALEQLYPLASHFEK